MRNLFSILSALATVQGLSQDPGSSYLQLSAQSLASPQLNATFPVNSPSPWPTVPFKAYLQEPLSYALIQSALVLEAGNIDFDQRICVNIENIIRFKFNSRKSGMSYLKKAHSRGQRLNVINIGSCQSIKHNKKGCSSGLT